MTKFILLSLALAGFLASCGSSLPETPITPVPPIPETPVTPIPPISVPAPIPFTSFTSLDATIDLASGINAFLGTDPVGALFSLVKLGAPANSRTLLAQTTVATDGHARLALPDATAIAPFLDEFTPKANPSCTTISYNVTPSTFRAVSAGEAIQIGKATYGYTGFLSLYSSGADKTGRQGLLYVDQDVIFNTSENCFSSGREDRTTINYKLLKGWNLITDSTIQSGTATAPVYTHTVSNTQTISSLLSLKLIGSLQTAAPLP